MDADPLAAGAEVADSPDGVRADEHPSFGPPERDLPPPAAARDRQELERRGVELRRRDRMVGHAEPLRDRRRVALVAVEERHDTADLAEVRCTPLGLGPRDRIDQPDAAAFDEGV
jgi:hypothetical protein